MRTIGMVLVVVLICPVALTAQSTGFRREMVAAAAVRPASPAVGSDLATASRDLAAARRFTSRAPGATLMIIGASAVVAGILVGGSGGTLLIIGGIGVGAYGVYLFTQ
jgi:hypothetical protein